MDNSDRQRKEMNLMRQRFTLVSAVLSIAIMAAILFNVLHIQFTEGDQWKYWQSKQVVEDKVIPATRGNIYADNGALMAATIPTYALYMDFQTYLDRSLANRPEEQERLHQNYLDSLESNIWSLAEALSRKLQDKTPEEYVAHLHKGLERGSREYQVSRVRVSYFDLQEIQQYPFYRLGRNRSGLFTKNYTERKKIFGSLASRTIGDIYTDMGKGGKNGLELYYDDVLKGKDGRGRREKVSGRYMDVIEEAPVPGSNLHTTINLVYQDIVETALRNMLIQTEASNGCAILLEVNTGRVKAISNLGRQSSGYYGEISNYAVSDRSEPGSTFKTVAMMAALEEGRVRPEDLVDVGNGRYVLPGSNGMVITDHNVNHGGYGEITAEKSIWYSSNIGMAKLISNGFQGKKEAARFVDRIYKMGICEDLCLEIPGAEHPYIPHPNDSNRYWSATDLPTMAYGYVTAIPPMYTCAFYNAIANDGCLMRPYFVDYIERDGVIEKKFEPQVVRKSICSERTLKEIRTMLEGVITSGTGRGAISSEVVSIAGKTGTAQISKGSTGYKAGGKNYQVSFCGYFPADKPKYTCMVVIRDPKIGYASGSTMAGGVFHQIAEQVYSKDLHVQVEKMPDDTLDIRPKVAAGLLERTSHTMDRLHVRTSMPEGDRFSLVEERPDTLAFDRRPMQAGQVPSVIGMGLRDALYVLESAGLQVNVQGHGRVYYQSLRIGQACRQGQEITIRLK